MHFKVIHAPPNKSYEGFSDLARKRVRQLNSHFREIVKTGNSEAVHDFRKATRHLQTIIDISGRHPGRAKKYIGSFKTFDTLPANGAMPTLSCMN